MLWLAATLAPAAPAAVEADQAGNREVAFAAVATEGRTQPGALHCTRDRRWCASLRIEARDGGWRLEVLGRDSVSVRDLDLPMADNVAGFAIRDRAVLQADGALLIGIERTSRAGYSGGGVSATVLELVRVEASGDPAPMFEVPVAARKDIRACFGAEDRRRRRGACADRYEFSGTLALDPANASGPPRFVLTTRARTFPGRRTLESDSTTAPALHARDLAWWTDPACSYRRIFTFDAAAEGYMSDAPPPDCGAYLDP